MTYMLAARSCRPGYLGDIAVDVYSKSKRSEIMSRVKNKRTSPEEKVAALLSEFRFRYRQNDRTLPGNPDFSIRSRKVAIFVNGCFWHGHRNCSRAKLPQTNVGFWTSKIELNKSRDRRAIRELHRMGWSVITVWQCRLRQPQKIATKLAHRLARRPPKIAAKG
jgi:DNA mismatch endonuclease (patch repair protein)